MNKHLTKILAMILLLPIIFIGCQKSELMDDSKNIDGNTSLKSTIAYCGEPQVLSLVQDTAPTVSYGTLTIGNDETNLYVTFEATAGWLIVRTDLYAGPESDIPGFNINNGSGYFHVGQFPYHSEHPGLVQSYMYTLPLDQFSDCFAVVAHSLIRVEDGSLRRVWGKSALKAESGYYFEYCKQTCTTPPPPPPPPPLGGCETAYAYGESFATCFLDIPGVTSNNWGWSNGQIGAGTYAWPIYAGAGQCNIGNATHVGTLQVNYTPPTAVVTYTMFDGYILNETHLYVGNQILPKKNNKWTTAPGQFPYKHGTLNGVSSDSFTIGGLSGNIYVVAHSVACDDI